MSEDSFDIQAELRIRKQAELHIRNQHILWLTTKKKKKSDSQSGYESNVFQLYIEIEQKP